MPDWRCIGKVYSIVFQLNSSWIIQNPNGNITFLYIWTTNVYLWFWESGIFKSKRASPKYQTDGPFYSNFNQILLTRSPKNIPKLDFRTSLVLVFFVFVFGHPFLVMKILSWFSRSKLQEIFKNWQNLWHQYPSVPRQRSFEPLHYV